MHEDEAALLAANALSRLRGKYASNCGLPEFMQAADATQQALFEALNAAYSHETFAKLVALKLTNLAVARRLYTTKELALASRPIQLMLDPANNCQLHCPSCVHTSTENKHWFDWPGGLLSPSMFSLFMDALGPFAFSAVFYNYGEPLLNANTPAYVRAAKAHLLSTVISSNMMLLRDADELVDSGLDYLIASIDGVSQETYSRYRKGGEVAECFANVRRLVDAKRRTESVTPYIVWQFLTFEHNVADVERALTLAAELGVDELLVATPFDVSADDPTLRPARSDAEGRHHFGNAPTRRHDRSRVPARSPVVDQEFAMSWVSRLGAADAHEPVAARDGPTCSWLYQSITLDAVGRIMPCCAAPSESFRNYVYGDVGSDDSDWFNSERFAQSRLAYRNRAAYEQARGQRSGANRTNAPRARRLPRFDDDQGPYCASCTKAPAPVYSTDVGVPIDVASMDPLHVLPMSEVQFWSAWT